MEGGDLVLQTNSSVQPIRRRISKGSLPPLIQSSTSALSPNSTFTKPSSSEIRSEIDSLAISPTYCSRCNPEHSLHCSELRGSNNKIMQGNTPQPIKFSRQLRERINEQDIEELVQEWPKLEIELVHICTCQQSKEFPICDKSHEIFNRETNSNMEPKKMYLISPQSSAEHNYSTTPSSPLKSLEEKSIQKYSTQDDLQHQPTFNDKSSDLRMNNQSNQTKTELDYKKLPDNQTNKQFNQQTQDPTRKESKTRTKTKSEEDEVKMFKKVDKKLMKDVYTTEEVSKHCTAEDCWMIIKGNVYDITQYFDLHPGGTRALLKFAGKDGTENVQFHSPKMMQLLDMYFYKGKLQGADGGSCIIS